MDIWVLTYLYCSNGNFYDAASIFPEVHGKAFRSEKEAKNYLMEITSKYYHSHNPFNTYHIHEVTLIDG